MCEQCACSVQTVWRTDLDHAQFNEAFTSQQTAVSKLLTNNCCAGECVCGASVCANNFQFAGQSVCMNGCENGVHVAGETVCKCVAMISGLLVSACVCVDLSITPVHWQNKRTVGSVCVRPSPRPPNYHTGQAV